MATYSTNAASQAWIESIERAWESEVRVVLKRQPGLTWAEAEDQLTREVDQMFSTNGLPKQLSDDADALMRYWGWLK